MQNFKSTALMKLRRCYQCKLTVSCNKKPCHGLYDIDALVHQYDIDKLNITIILT